MAKNNGGFPAFSLISGIIAIPFNFLTGIVHEAMPVCCIPRISQ